MAEIVVMPKMNLTMEEGIIVEWCKQIGDPVKAEELLCSIETEKSVVEMESPASGVLLKVWGIVGERYPVATPIALIGQAGEDVTALIAKVEQQLAGVQPEAPAEKPIVPTQPVLTETRAQVRMLPRVRKIAQELGIDIPTLAKFYGDRRITEEDVRAFHQASRPAEEHKLESLPGDRRVKMTSMRRTIAAKMSESSQKTARLTNVTEADMTRAMEILLDKKEEKLSLTALVVKACALAIRDHEIINTVVEGEEIIFRSGIHVGVAIDISNGLVVPVIHDADTKDISKLTQEIANLAARAQKGSLTQEELTGGTFTVTNVGMLGIDVFTPIINFPQTAIMGIGTIKRLPRYLEDAPDVAVPRNIMNLCLTYDHRVIDGAPAARFSLQVRDLLQNPDVLFE